MKILLDIDGVVLHESGLDPYWMRFFEFIQRNNVEIKVFSASDRDRIERIMKRIDLKPTQIWSIEDLSWRNGYAKVLPPSLDSDWIIIDDEQQNFLNLTNQRFYSLCGFFNIKKKI